MLNAYLAFESSPHMTTGHLMLVLIHEVGLICTIQNLKKCTQLTRRSTVLSLKKSLNGFLVQRSWKPSSASPRPLGSQMWEARLTLLLPSEHTQWEKQHLTMLIPYSILQVINNCYNSYFIFWILWFCI